MKKIHTKIVMKWDPESGQYKTIRDNFYFYDGPTAECYGYAAAIIAVVAAGITAYSQYQQGQYQEDVAKYNAKVGEYEAQAIESQRDADIQAHREQVRRLKASQRVAMLKSGVTLDSPTALEILSDTERQSLLDERTIKYNADLSAWARRSGSRLSLAEGKQAAYAGRLGATGTILNTASKFDYSKKGVPTYRG